MKQLLITVLVTIMPVLPSFGQTGEEDPYKEPADYDEVTLADSMIALRTLPKAARLLEEAGYKLQLSSDFNKLYSKMGGGLYSMFNIKKSMFYQYGKKLRFIRFTTVTPSIILRMRLLELGYEQLSVDEEEVTYRKDNVSVSMTGDRLLPAFIVEFSIDLDNEPQKKT